MRGREWEGEEHASRPYTTDRALSGGHTGFVGAGEHSLGNPSQARSACGGAERPPPTQAVCNTAQRKNVRSFFSALCVSSKIRIRRTLFDNVELKSTRLPTWKKFFFF